MIFQSGVIASREVEHCAMQHGRRAKHPAAASKAAERTAIDLDEVAAARRYRSLGDLRKRVSRLKRCRPALSSPRTRGSRLPSIVTRGGSVWIPAFAGMTMSGQVKHSFSPVSLGRMLEGGPSGSTLRQRDSLPQ